MKVICDLLSLPDLVLAKKTQRDKDWPMIRRLVEAHYFENEADSNFEQIDFWIRELRTPTLLITSPLPSTPPLPRIHPSP
jgi:hypothetical protein